MFKRINIFNIIKDHLRTLRRFDTVGERMSLSDFLLFFMLPMLIASALTYRQIDLGSHVTDLITSISILGGFLFNLLAIVYGLMDKLQADARIVNNDRHNLKEVFVKEIHTNISFNIVISLLMLFLLISQSFIRDYNVCLVWSNDNCYINSLFIIRTISWLVYTLLGTFSLTMLMILNRIYILLNKD